ncbi:MAG: DoxX family protein [Ferruginibacter sp.]
MQLNKIIYWVSTIIFCGIFLFSAIMYFTRYEMVKVFFESFGYPIYIIYPLAIAKVLGVVAILSKKSRVLKEWAYAGFFFDAALATAAHLHAKDGGQWFALTAMAMLIISRIFDSKIFKPK